MVIISPRARLERLNEAHSERSPEVRGRSELWVCQGDIQSPAGRLKSIKNVNKLDIRSYSFQSPAGLYILSYATHSSFALRASGLHSLWASLSRRCGSRKVLGCFSEQAAFHEAAILHRDPL